MTMTTLELRTALCERGYLPVPCSGKAPTLARWQEPLAMDRDSMARWPGLNTGAKTSTTPVMDIDITQPEAADVVDEIAKDWFSDRGVIPTRFGNAPKRALFFRTETPFRKMAVQFEDESGKRHKIEILVTASRSSLPVLTPILACPTPTTAIPCGRSNAPSSSR